MVRNLSDRDIQEINKQDAESYDRRKKDRRKVHTMIDPSAERRKGERRKRKLNVTM
jgi:hypothetical protein